MTTLEVAIQIKSLRAQLDVLEARLQAEPSQPGHTLADLRGVVQVDPPTTTEEIEASQYRQPPCDDQ